MRSLGHVAVISDTYLFCNAEIGSKKQAPTLQQGTCFKSDDYCVFIVSYLWFVALPIIICCIKLNNLLVLNILLIEILQCVQHNILILAFEETVVIMLSKLHAVTEQQSVILNELVTGEVHEKSSKCCGQTSRGTWFSAASCGGI